jgi:cytochrome c oxidase subunit III
MMAARIEKYKEEKEQYSMNPVKFMLWLFLVTVTMMFAGFTSAMVVRKAAGNWEFFNIPSLFTVSTIIIALSSVSMQWAYFSARKNDISRNRLALWITVALGLAFMVIQFFGYRQLMEKNVFLIGNPSGSFFYIISGVHALHVVGGIIFLFFALLSSYQYKIHSKNMLRMNLCTTYWHFIGGLWIYLFVILTLLR